MDEEEFEQGQFAQQFKNIDTNNDGLITFEDFKHYIMLNQFQNSANTSNLSMEEISYITQLYQINKKRSIKQMRQVANYDNRLSTFDKFFANYGQNDSVVESDFAQIVEKAENVIFGYGNNIVKDLDKPEETKTAVKQQQPDKKQESSQKLQKQEKSKTDEIPTPPKVQPVQQQSLTRNNENRVQKSFKMREKSVIATKEDSAKVVGICIGFLQEEQTDIPELEIQDVLNLLLDNHSTITNQEWPIFVKALSDKHEQVIKKIENLDNKGQQVLTKLEEVQMENTDIQAMLEAKSRMLSEIESDYNLLQKQIAEILPKYQMLTDLKIRNGQLTTQVSEKNYELSSVKAQLSQTQSEAVEFKQKFQQIEEKYLDQDTELRQARQQLRDAGINQIQFSNNQKTRPSQGRFTRLGTLARGGFGGNRQSAVNSLYQKKRTIVGYQREESIIEENEQSDLTDAMEQSYLKAIQQLQTSKEKLSLYEQQSLKVIISEYQKYKEAMDVAMDEAEECAQAYEELEIDFNKSQLELEQYQKRWKDESYQVVSLKTQIEHLTNENEELRSQVETLQLELISNSLFEKAGLQKEWSRIQNEQLQQQQQQLEQQQSKLAQELQAKTLIEIEFNQDNYQSSQTQNEIIQLDQRRETIQTPTIRPQSDVLDSIQEIEEIRDSQVESRYSEQQHEIIQSEDQVNENQNQQIDQQNEIENNQNQNIDLQVTSQNQFDYEPLEMEFDTDNNNNARVSVVEGALLIEKPQDSTNQQNDLKKHQHFSFQPSQNFEYQDNQLSESQKQANQVIEGNNKNNLSSNKSDSDDENDENQDKVGQLPTTQAQIGNRVTNSLFDAVIDSQDGKTAVQNEIEPESTRTNQTFKKEGERNTVLKDLMNRASNISVMQKQAQVRSSMIAQASKNNDFDYLSLRKMDHKNFKQINQVLKTYSEDGSFVVFSDNIQQFDAQLKLTDQIILITQTAFYLFDKKFNFKSRELIKDLNTVILIKTNPGVFTLNFKGNAPFLIQTFRRTELVVYLLTQRDNMGMKTNLFRSEGLKITMKSGKSQTLYFDKNEIGKNVDSNQKQLLKSLQLNNFVNAIKSGYLEKLEHSFFKGNTWEQRFCVLTNVGLLYFSNPLNPPTDLFPVLDCKIDKLQPNEDGFTDGSYSIKLVYASKKAIFRCLSRSDYENWFKAIMQLQSTCEEKRQELKINEEKRLTMIARGMGVEVSKSKK